MSLAVLLLSALVAQTDAGPVAEEAPPSAPRRWQLEPLEVTGTPHKPGVLFVDPERENARAAMQALLAETAGGQFGVEVSRPTELPERRTRVRHLKVRGALRDGQVLRAVEAVLPDLPSCRLADRRPPPTDIEIDVELKIADDGRVDARVRGMRPTAPRTALCVVGRLKRAELPSSAAGSATIELGIVLPAPYATGAPAEGALGPGTEKSTGSSTTVVKPPPSPPAPKADVRPADPKSAPR